MKIDVYISYHVGGAQTGKRQFPLYGLHIYINNKPIWTTYITAEDYRQLEAQGIQRI